MLPICVNKKNGNKFYHRKSMWAVDEKLIINELGFYVCARVCVCVCVCVCWNTSAENKLSFKRLVI